MKGIPDNMYICLRRSFTEKQVKKALAHYIKQRFIPILSELGFDVKLIAGREFTEGELIHLIVTAIRDYQAKLDSASKRILAMEKQTLNKGDLKTVVSQCLLDFTNKH